MAGDPTSKWKSLSTAPFFFFLEGITLCLLEIGLFSLGALLELVFRDLLLLEPVVLELLTLGKHAQRGLLYLVCVSVCVCVCLCVCLSPLILALQGPSRLISDTNGSKIMW